MSELAVNALHYGDNLEVMRAQIPDEVADLSALEPPSNLAVAPVRKASSNAALWGRGLDAARHAPCWGDTPELPTSQLRGPRGRE